MESRGMEGEWWCSFSLTFRCFDSPILVIPNFYAFVFASSRNERLSQTQIHSNDWTCMKMQAYLLHIGSNRIFETLKTHLALKHHTARKQGEYFVIVWTDAADVNLLLRKLECSFSLKHTLFKSPKFKTLGPNEESFGPVAKTITNLIDFLNDTTLVVDY